MFLVLFPIIYPLDEASIGKVANREKKNSNNRKNVVNLPLLWKKSTK